VGRGLRR